VKETGERLSVHSDDIAPVISSLHNPAIKRARSLLRRKGRSEERAFLVEGIRAVEDAIAAGVHPEVLFIRNDDAGHDLVLSYPHNIPVRFASADVMNSLSDVPHPQGVVAVIAMSDVGDEPDHDVYANDFLLVADGVRDPGNLGTLIRTAAAAGVTELIVTPESVDPFNPKCVRSAMSAHFLVPIRQLTWPEVHARLEAVPVVALLDADGTVDYDQQDWTGDCAIVVGGEAFGAHEGVRALTNTNVRIPMARNLESLNAGVAGSLVLLEAARQRRAGKRLS
jgi:TrmH family RNA methyltransferase